MQSRCQPASHISLPVCSPKMAFLPLEDILIFTLNWFNHFNICRAKFCQIYQPAFNAVDVQSLLNFIIGQL